MINISRKEAEDIVKLGGKIIRNRDNFFYLIWEGIEFYIYDYDYPTDARDTTESIS